MARTRPPSPPQGFVASAVGLPTYSRNMAGRLQAWQGQAWDFWDSTGELRYPSQWIGNVMSRASLVAAHREGKLLIPVHEGPAAEAMEQLYGGPQGQAEMLQAFGVHLTVAGEGYLTHHDDRWCVLATGKVTQSPGKPPKLRADYGTEGGAVELGPDDFVLRVWTPHPNDPTRADSPVRANLNTLSQIRAYDAHIDAQLRSRLAGAGILFLPSEVEFAMPEGIDPQASQAEGFMALLGEAMMTPISNPADASAVVPIVVMAPGEHLEKPHLLHFWSDLDAAVTEMRDAAIKRLALGLDVPPEVLLGIADANHWNAWLSEESAIKAHIEPRLSVVAAGLTTGYLRPALTGVVPDLEDYYVLADTASIRLRPNRSTEAIELFDRGQLSGVALRRETGFQPADAPSADEFRIWLLRKIATGSTDPSQTEAALALLGADLNTSTPPSQGNTLPPDDLRTDTGPSLVERNPPTPPAYDNEPALAAACEVLVYRALERAGNKLKNGHPLTDAKAMPAHTIYMSLTGDPDHLLEGAWECAREVLGPFTDEADIEGVVGVLDFYVRGLLASRRSPSTTVLSTLLKTRPTPLEAIS